MSHISRGRPRKTDTPVEWKVCLPKSLADTVTLLLTDPLTQRAKFGSRSQLIEILLRNWIADLRRSTAAPDTVVAKPLDTCIAPCDHPHSITTPSTE